MGAEVGYPEQGGPPHPDSFEAGDLKTAFDGAQTLGSPLMRMLIIGKKPFIELLGTLIYLEDFS